VERVLDVEGEWLKGIYGPKFGYTGRVAETELWSDRWMYRTSG